MFTKILIANRGEIACRAMRTARRMGVSTVAVYSEADRDALHVRSADEAVLVGAPPAAESYLDIDKIVNSCRQTGSEAVYPGYGFLSENPAFARRLEAEQIVFIGPGADAIEAMGDKITSKAIAERAGVNTIPGCPDVIADADHAVRVASEIGYPVMLKASAGGGGKGMRIARDDRQCREGFDRAASEARSSFGDDRVFIEKFIEQPRHIEIQIMADAHGNVVSLNERECSIQRRHQKVLEEAPSPCLDSATRAAMSEQAVRLARAVDYRSAGTAEFIVDKDGNFFFLEMNTRLQVEHPVTEFVTGLDLIEMMLRIASGERLPVTQDQVRLDGWSVEARVYAENPFRGFLPSTGRLVRYIPPGESPTVRIDTGVDEGGEVSIHYDPLVAKLITYGASRRDAVDALGRALNEFYIRGVQTNIPFLAALVRHPRFRAGDLSTDFIADEYPDGFLEADVAGHHPVELIAVAATVQRRYMDRAAGTTGQLKGHERVVGSQYVVKMGGEDYRVGVTSVHGGHEVVWDDVPMRVVSDWQFGQPLFHGTVNNRPLCVQVERDNVCYRLIHNGIRYDALVMAPYAAALMGHMPVKTPPDMSKYLLAPMPGLLVSLLVEPGQTVEPDQDLAVIEAMKMENLLKAERPGTVAGVLAQTGDTLEVDQPILEFE